MTTLWTTAAHTGRAVTMMLALLLAGLVAAALLPARALAQEGFVPTRFSVEVIGEGPDVILIPGLSTSREVWRGNAEALQGHFRLHLVQVKGFGEPAGPNAEGPLLEPLVAELARYIEAEGLQQPAVAGHSLGGLIALKLAAEHPQLAGKLMIVDALPWFAATMLPGGVDATPATVEPQARMLRDALVASHGQPQPPGAADAAIARYLVDQGKLPVLRAWTADADPRVTGQLVYEDLLADMRRQIADIQAPVTMVYPWNATGPTREQAEAFYRREYAALSGVAFVGIGPAAHFLMLDQPEAFQAALVAFLAD